MFWAREAIPARIESGHERSVFLCPDQQASYEGVQMTSIACVGDANTHGGFIITGSSTMLVLGRQVARQFDLISCPMHGVNEIIEGSDMVLDNGRMVALDGHRCACGCSVIAGGSFASVR